MNVRELIAHLQTIENKNQEIEITGLAGHKTLTAADIVEDEAQDGTPWVTIVNRDRSSPNLAEAIAHVDSVRRSIAASHPELEVSLDRALHLLNRPL